MKAIVIGAGIGGLSAAVALEKAGIDCTVFGSSKRDQTVGAAISIWPNGVKCMQHSAWATSLRHTAGQCALWPTRITGARRHVDPL